MNKEQKRLTLRTCQVHVTRQTTFCSHININYKIQSTQSNYFQTPASTHGHCQIRTPASAGHYGLCETEVHHHKLGVYLNARVCRAEHHHVMSPYMKSAATTIILMLLRRDSERQPLRMERMRRRRAPCMQCIGPPACCEPSCSR